MFSTYINLLKDSVFNYLFFISCVQIIISISTNILLTAKKNYDMLARGFSLTISNCYLYLSISFKYNHALEANNGVLLMRLEILMVTIHYAL